MQIHFTGHNIEITPALRSYAEDKLNKLEKHFDKITSIHVIFDVQKLNQIVEASINVARGELHARSESEDMYASIDGLIDKLDRQLIKHKEKIQNHRE
ncbi:MULTISPECIES: ribosome hibernation-promoting factor, HPF/YfiA family [Legionella]|uniref:Ribosome hibernation promoting factor n=1 Tax=Legionella maceachernii TaxID=466 RepID=A0A0W0VV82_9GAMM|nr:ribosome-associated translation inhibitor RaiA [Legionella maceachernii]KTD23987.1 ribosome-associated, sigma 54 modulation protein [Legionella maceachernii]SKA19293.1 putative sigma-54 modulation protein [Legionella maceachernii]SUP04384.1 ribosome hibernation promoting factor HPF [Legionella maceachernii]